MTQPQRWSRRALQALSWGFSVVLFTASIALAEVVDFEVVRVVPAFDGRSFEGVGTYQLVVGVAHGEVDPAAPENALIADIDLAPKNERGMVEYTTPVEILRPSLVDAGNQRLLFEVLNRGNKGMVGRLNEGPGGNDMASDAASAGDGFLFERGYTVAWAGWQSAYNVSEGNGRMIADIPIAHAPDGSSLTQQVLQERIFNDDDSTDVALLFPTADLAAPDGRLLVHNSSSTETTPAEAPRSTWEFVDERTVRIDRSDPFFDDYDAGAIYRIIYTAKDPDVSGLGFAITRDVVSFLRYDDTFLNPLRGTLNYALAHGNSQSGRMLKGFIYEGFNRDESGRIVFDGVNPNISGSHAIDLNRRFGDANATGRAYERFTGAKLEFPFTYAVTTDAFSGDSDGIFRACLETGTCPKIAHTDSANEAWGKASMLVTTDGLGHDVALPDNVRVYYFAGTQHGPDDSPSVGRCQQLSNPNRWQPHLRALIVGLDGWATAGFTPPASAYARVSDGTLVPALPQELFGFPHIPGLDYTGINLHRIFVLDKSQLPYRAIPDMEYTVMVPRVDQDGNELAGIRSVDVQVPTGTYTGWALRGVGFAEGEECTLQGQYIPFAQTQAERQASGDPRLSIEERYGSHGQYVREVAAAAERLVAAGYLLPQDADTAVGAAAASNVGLE